MREHIDKVTRHAAQTGRSVPPSTTIVLSSEGHVWTANAVSTSLPSADMLVLNLSDTPVRDPASRDSTAGREVPRLRSLPVNPYPTPVGSPVSVFAFRNPVQWAGERQSSSTQHEWIQGTVVEYRDAMGKEAKVRWHPRFIAPHVERPMLTLTCSMSDRHI